MAKRVLMMAGGTGGHVFPALACAAEFQKRGYEVHWLGTPRGIENELIPAAGIELHRIDISGLRGKGALSLFKAPWNIVRAVFQARRILKKLKPVCVVGMGGFVTGPGGLAARIQGTPLVIHEQNAVAGTANRLLAPIANVVCEGFPNTFPASRKRRNTGNPVRESLFLTGPRDDLVGRRPRLLVLGGSLGAEPINKLVPAALALLPVDQRPEVLHQAGRQHDSLTRERYDQLQLEARVEPFIADMAAAYSWADMVLCRAGALTISELAAAGLPAFLIPLPHAIDDHQRRNAEFLAQDGAAVLLPQATTDAAVLAGQISEVMMHPQTLIAMGEAARRLSRPHATQEVVDLCVEVAHG